MLNNENVLSISQHKKAGFDVKKACLDYFVL